MFAKTLTETLRDYLKDDHKVSLYEAKVIREMIIADGELSKEERLLLEESLGKNQFGVQAANLLSELLLRMGKR